jgi:hypothetical protein
MMRLHQVQPLLLKNLPMRTTLSLADDAALIARQCAARDHVSLGEAVSRLVREGYRAQTERPATQGKLKSPYSVLPMRDEIITSEHVRRLMDEEGI